MNWVDLVIVGALALAALRGYAEGALGQVGGYGGLYVGFVAGSIVAPSIATDLTRSNWRALIALAIVLTGTIVGSSAGQFLGALASRLLRSLRLGLADRVGGVLVGVLGALVVCWLSAGLLASTTWGSLASQIQGSYVLKTLDSVMPPLPAVEAKVQALFRSVDLPGLFASVVAPTLPPQPAPRLGASVASLAGPTSVVKVLAGGRCGQEREGTAFFVGAHEVVTNAHVVAGESVITVDGMRAQVALFDPREDVAVLRVASLERPVLTLSSAVARTGVAARIIGFPLNSSRTLTPARVRGEITAQGRDIYYQQLFTRTVLVLWAQVSPGNSGSPVLVGTKVVGVVVSKSLSEPETAYAIPAATIRAELARTPARGVVSTMSCLN